MRAKKQNHAKRALRAQRNYEGTILFCENAGLKQA